MKKIRNFPETFKLNVDKCSIPEISFNSDYNRRMNELCGEKKRIKLRKIIQPLV